MIKSLPNLYSSIGLTKEEIIILTANISNLYTLKIQPKKKFGEDQIDKYGGVKYRNLRVPQFKLKKAQKRIDSLLQKITLPDNMFGSVKGKNNLLNAAQHLNHKYFLTIDLKNFFSSISNHQVFRMLYTNGFSHATARILTQLTTSKGFLPQGAPSSPVIANLVVADLIREISAFVSTFGITFTVSVDDLTFSSNTCFKNRVSEILSIIKKNGFFPAHKKIHYRINSCEVTGLFVYANQLRVSPEMRRKAYNNIHLNAYVKRVEKFNREIKNK